jgi:HD superfamily phosphohydrolase
VSERIEFYDPLYETIIFERGMPTGRGFHLAPAEGPLDPRDVIRSAEFTRLAFLRQVGLAWLIFPSATHTRFAHSIGCWWLGRIAESLIKVCVQTESPKDRDQLDSPGSDSQEHSGLWEMHPLRWWLEFHGLREEFYLGLLLHDIGHGPLSHVLEHNPDFVEALRSAGLNEYTHEARGAALLSGQGPLAKQWTDFVQANYCEGTRTLGEIKDRLLAGGGQICFPAISYFMTGELRHKNDCTHDHKAALGVVKELISGVLDLDRLDHYARDSYFSGLRQVALNVQGFLSSVRIRLPQRETGPNRWQMALYGQTAYFTLTDDGASHAASLLFSKRQIISTMFRNPRSVALHAMANRGLSLVLRTTAERDRPNLALRIAMMQDGEFQQMLQTSQSDECRYIAKRLAGVDPYVCVGKWPNSIVSANRPRMRREVERIAESQGLILFADRAFWDKGMSDVGREWLDTSAIMLDETGRPLTEHADHRNDFAHLRESGNLSYLWAFSNDVNTGKDKAKTLVDALTRAMK